ncbi:retrovirus-related pol polyprotein from transposon TNT 1-94 [Tanacetum coccineum]
METKNTSSSGSVLEEPEIQKLQMQAKIFKENSLNKLMHLNQHSLLERQKKHFTKMGFINQLYSVIKVQFESSLTLIDLLSLSILIQFFFIRSRIADSQCKVKRSIHRLQVQEMNKMWRIVSDEEIRYTALGAHYEFMAKMQFLNPTVKSMEVLIKTLLMPLSDKTILDSHCFVHELKTEMHDDLEYVKSLEKEVDELESEKADFSNIYDLLLEECVSKDVICSYLHSLSDLNAHTGLQCLYLHKVKECECLAQKLSKQTESVNKEVHNNLLKSFSKLEKHSISLELALQQCKEQMKNNSVCKENRSNVFRKEREQYHEIQDLKAQMQDKNIAISELKKLIEMFKRKGVDTNFEQPSILGKPPVQSIRNQPVVRQPTAYKSERYQCPQQRFASQVDVSNKLTKPATPHSWHQMKESSLAKPNDLIAPGPSRNCPKHVSHQSPREKVGSNDMVHNYYLEKAKKSAQLQKDKDVNGKPSMIDPARLPNTANGCKPKPRNWQASMSSRVSNKDVHLGEHRKQKPFLKFNELQCPTCKKCLYSANHDECVLEYLSRLNPRASAQNKDAKSHKTTKRYMPVEKSSASKKPERQIPTGHRFSNKKTTTVPEKTMNPRSCLRWKPTGRIFSNVRLRWIPTGKLLNSCTGKVDSEPAHGSIVDIPHIHACKQTLGLSAGTSFNGQKQQRIDLNADALYNEKQENLRVWLLKLLISKKPVPECSDLAPQRQEMSVENVSSGLVPQGQKASDYDNSDPVPPRQMLFLRQRRQIRHNKGRGSTCSAEGFVDPDHPEKVTFLRKALYGLKQAPRAWYDELSNFLMSKGFTKGTIDPTLFKIKYGEDILLVQIYVDDIIFGSTNPKYSKRFEKLMHSRFEMSLMGEMKFFLGLQIHQSPKDLSGEPVDQFDYRSKIGSLMYLTSSRPDLVQAVCYCARYQARPTQKHLKEVKRIFKYLKGTINMGLWYPKDFGFELTVFSDADHVRCVDTRKSTSGGIQFLGDKLVSWMSKKQNCTAMSSAEAEYVALSASCAQVMWMRTHQDYSFH